MPANQSPFSSLDCSHLLLSYSPWTLHWIFISPPLPQGQTVIYDVVLELRGKLQSEAGPASPHFFFSLCSNNISVHPLLSMSTPILAFCLLTITTCLTGPREKAGGNQYSAVILSTGGWSHGGGGEWARCRFAFLLMHTASPLALSSFYRVCLLHLHPVIAVLYMLLSVLIPKVHGSISPPRTALLGMCFWPPELTLRWQA